MGGAKTLELEKEFRRIKYTISAERRRLKDKEMEIERWSGIK